MLLMSSFLHCQAQRALGERVTLREARVLARSLGVLRDAHGRRRWTARVSAALPCCDPVSSFDEARSHTSTSHSEASDVVPDPLDPAAWRAVARERQDGLFDLAHCARDDDLVGASVSSVNQAHIEGVVTRVELGSVAQGPAPCNAFQVGERVPRKVVHIVPLSSLRQPLLQLWINVADEVIGCDDDATSVPLAVWMQLSRDALLAWWSQQQQQEREQDHYNATADKRGVAESGDKARSYAAGEIHDAHDVDEDEGWVEHALVAHRAWLQVKLLHQRVIVSGKLCTLRLYDEDVRRVVDVPLLWLPADGLSKACRVVTRPV